MNLEKLAEALKIDVGILMSKQETKDQIYRLRQDGYNVYSAKDFIISEEIYKRITELVEKVEKRKWWQLKK